VYNGATLVPDTGTQTTASVTTSGPLVGLTSITNYKVTAVSVEIQPITSTLTNQGRIVATMSNATTAAASLVAPNGVSTARDCEYVVYSALQASAGHRLVYFNSSDPNGSFTQYGQPSEYDYL